MPNNFLDAFLQGRRDFLARKSEEETRRMQADQFSQQLGLRREEMDLNRTESDRRFAQQQNQNDFENQLNLGKGISEGWLANGSNGGQPNISLPPDIIENITTIAPPQTPTLRVGSSTVSFVPPEIRARQARAIEDADLRQKLQIQADEKMKTQKELMDLINDKNLPFSEEDRRRLGGKLFFGVDLKDNDYKTFQEAWVNTKDPKVRAQIEDVMTRTARAGANNTYIDSPSDYRTDISNKVRSYLGRMDRNKYAQAGYKTIADQVTAYAQDLSKDPNFRSNPQAYDILGGLAEEAESLRKNPTKANMLEGILGGNALPPVDKE
jgi:hypothetical protein